MEINKYPFSHKSNKTGETEDEVTIQAEVENVQILTQLTNNYLNFKETLDIFGGEEKIEDITVGGDLLGQLLYKHAYRNINTTDIILTDGVSPNILTTVTLSPGSFIYCVSTASPRRYVWFSQPYQLTYKPIIDKNGNIIFEEDHGNFISRILKGPVSNACWTYSALVSSVSQTIGVETYLDILVENILSATSNIQMLPWDIYDIAFFDSDGEKVSIEFEDDTYNTTTHEYYQKDGKYHLHIKVLSQISQYLLGLTIRVY